MRIRSSLKFIALALIALGFCLLSIALPLTVPGSLDPALAQYGAQAANWEQVYEQIPDLPRENQYVNRETGEAATNNTLVTRLIQYHLYVQTRVANSRLDWKLTMADLLGVNQWVVPRAYPGADTLHPNPVEGDTAAIGQLNRAQRDALVDALVALFVAPSDAPPSPSAAVPSRQVPAEPNAAQLLQP